MAGSSQAISSVMLAYVGVRVCDEGHGSSIVCEIAVVRHGVYGM